MSSVRPAHGSGAEIYVMKDPTSEALKKQMHDFWNEQSSDTQVPSADYLSSSALPPSNWFYRRALPLAVYDYG